MFSEQLLREFPQEFQSKGNIEILVRAFARQLDELYAASAGLKKLCDLDSARGKQLDGIGDIVVLSRSDAMRLIKGPITYDIMDDEHYRHYLRYKILKNTSTCTYYDIITAVQMLWGAEDIEYFENPEEPATVTLTFPDPGGAVQLDDIPPIIAAGVGMHIRAASTIRISQTLYSGACTGINEKEFVAPAYIMRTIRQWAYIGSSASLFEETALDVVRKNRQGAGKLPAAMGLFSVVRECAMTDLPHAPRTLRISQILPTIMQTAAIEEASLDMRRNDRRRSYETRGHMGLLTIGRERVTVNLNRAAGIPRMIEALSAATHLAVFEESVIRPSATVRSHAFSVGIAIGNLAVLHEVVSIKSKRRTPIEY